MTGIYAVGMAVQVPERTKQAGSVQLKIWRFPDFAAAVCAFGLYKRSDLLPGDEIANS